MRAASDMLDFRDEHAASEGIRRTAVPFLAMAALLFIPPALDYWQAWTFLAVYFAARSRSPFTS